MRISEWRNREKRVSNELRNFVRTDREDFENFSLRFFFPFQFLLEYPYATRYPFGNSSVKSPFDVSSIDVYFLGG